MVLQTGSVTLEISAENSQKVKNKSTIRPSYTISEYMPKDSTSYYTDNCSAVFIPFLLCSQ